MTTYFEDVVNFHKEVVGISTPNYLRIIPNERRRLRKHLMYEEFLELMDGMDACNIADIADGCADVIVTVLGTAAEYGIPFDKIWAEVHRSNMDKKGGPMRADGKMLKPEGWLPPQIRSILAEYHQ